MSTLKTFIYFCTLSKSWASQSEHNMDAETITLTVILCLNFPYDVVPLVAFGELCQPTLPLYQKDNYFR